ncbi:prolyl oligopeptidase family serine peptidase [Georgenia phoenicis]|uniref:S9 family peptidase n=1 Tax=unclassified Georgenia TaxID=2626815 RepID=UPI0039B0E6EB
MSRLSRSRGPRTRGARSTGWPPPVWEQRFRAPEVEVPEWARDAPDRACVVATVDGRPQVHSWEARTGRLVAATDRPAGTTDATIDPAGRWLWWFDDTDGDEWGTWRRQPFGSPPGRAETPLPLRPGYQAGLHLARDGTGVVGRTDPDAGTTIHQVFLDSPTAAPVLLYAGEHDAEAAALSDDGNLLAVGHAEGGDPRHPGLRVLSADTGATVAALDDGPGRGLWALDFPPLPGDSRLLVLHERTGTPRAAVWDVLSGAWRELALDVDGEVADATWYPSGDAVLLAVDHRARTRLHRHDLRTGRSTLVGPADGTVDGATARPDGEVWYSWSSAAEPPSVRTTATGRVLLAPVGPRPRASVGVRDVDVPGPGGSVHALLRVPATGTAPHPVVVDVHGGPADHRTDSFSPTLAAWVDQGFAVLSVNFRGSTGYGTRWRDAIEGDVGRAELADIAAVHDHLVAEGTLDPRRSVLAGASWGGYLTLLGLGTQPERWALGLADVPVADYVAAYEDELSTLQALDRALLGGSPQEAPEAWAAASPITYVDHVRAPVLLLAGLNDPRCPLRQVQRYADALRERGGVVELYQYGGGHGSLVVDERLTQMRLQLDFVSRHLSP